MTSRKISRNIIFLGLLIGLVAGCSEKSQTVDWYKEHKAEMEAKIKWCSNDMARASDPDCMNAFKARTLLTLDPKTSSALDNFKFKIDSPAKK